MGGVTLTLRDGLTGRVDATGLTPDRLATLSEAEIARLPLWVDGGEARLGDAFVVTGGGSQDVRVVGACSAVDGLGAEMRAGTLTIDGDAGARVAAGMTGGSVLVAGSVGDDAGLAMSGGTLRVDGLAGHRLGAAPPGASKGMSGGEIIVGGAAGNEAGARMRRGLIVVSGAVGSEAGRAMVAGSLVVFGAIAGAPGRGNKRGSIVAAGRVAVPATYAYACTYEPPHVRLTLTYLRRQYGLPIEERFVVGAYRRYCGDAGVPGKGEILEWVSA
jgi:formylmethanofuran dehydrogenase subunit C